MRIELEEVPDNNGGDRPAPSSNVSYLMDSSCNLNCKDIILGF